jgi:hypothetical protein
VFIVGWYRRYQYSLVLYPACAGGDSGPAPVSTSHVRLPGTAAEGETMSTARLQDRLDVIEVVNRFGWHTDHHEWDELSAVLAEELYLDYSAVFGVEPSTSPRADVLAQWEKLFSRVRTQHIITNHIVDVDNDSATCRAHFHAQHVAEVRHGDSQFLLAGAYRFGLARTEHSWRIASVVVRPIWSRGNLTILTG